MMPERHGAELESVSVRKRGERCGWSHVPLDDPRTGSRVR